MDIKNEITANEILRNIQDKFETQTEKGLAKYGHTVRPESLFTTDWINHAQEELIDALVYLECLKSSLGGIEEPTNVCNTISDETKVEL